jgi:L-seryl-tRNA(Ser) seleniumtransferase
MKSSDLRSIPSVDAILRTAKGQELSAQFGHNLSVSAVREVLSAMRQTAKGSEEIPSAAQIISTAERLASSWIRPSLVPVINASGIILHTNLGRAPLSAETIAAMEAISGAYNNLEFDLGSGKRGKRSVHAEELLKRLLDVESAFVVNNNAAATMLILSALARAKKVIIPHSQLVEIGGGFRVPDVMRQSGAKLAAIGTTNRIHLKDYENALEEGAALVMNAHHSNFKIIGFTTEPPQSEIADLAHRFDCPFVYDQGSGALLDSMPFGLPHEPTIQEALADGIDLVCFSGDKLLGGPQAGIIVGRADLMAKIKKHPFARAVRADKTCLAGVSATLTHYLKGEAVEKIPIWRMIARKEGEIRAQAHAWSNQLGFGQVAAGFSMVGGGSLPEEQLPTHLLSVSVNQPDLVMRTLRELPVPLIARIEDGKILFDPRTILPEQEVVFLKQMQHVFSSLISQE